jgi:hypothetical protein
VSFSPASLFAAGEPGVWYDPSDFSTMFQDSAGTTPVTAVEQPVGLLLDKSGRGNHATQVTSASRPVLSARVNLLLATATLATQSVTTLAATYTLAFSGAGIVTTTGTNIGVYSAGTHSITCTAGTLTLTVVGSVTTADLRVTNDGVGLPAYQAVVTSTDYDTTGFPYYLRFDGADDSMATNTITPGIDKAQVFAGVRKLSDATAGMLLESSSNAGGNNGALYFVTGPDPLAANRYSSATRGSAAFGAANIATTNIGNAPDTAVLSSTHDIAGDLTTIKRNNVSGASSNVDLGTGNFLAYPLYIGRRNNAALPFNGRIYSLITRFGANLDATTITDTETWVNGKTKAY